MVYVARPLRTRTQVGWRSRTSYPEEQSRRWQLRRYAAPGPESCRGGVRDVAHDKADVLIGSFDFDSLDGLEENGVGLAQGVLDGHRTSDLEGGFRGVDFMVGTIDELDGNVHDG